MRNVYIFLYHVYVDLCMYVRVCLYVYILTILRVHSFRYPYIPVVISVDGIAWLPCNLLHVIMGSYSVTWRLHVRVWVVSGCRRLFHTCSRSTSLRSCRCGCKHSCIISYGDKTYFEVLAENAIYPHELWYSWGLPPAPAYREIVWFLPASSRLQLIVW